MPLPLLSIICSALALCFWLRVSRHFLLKRSQAYQNEDLADHLPMDWPGLLSFVLPRPLRRAYHFFLVNIITAFIGAWHVYQFTHRRASPDFLQGYVITLLLFMLMLCVPAFFGERERIRRRNASAVPNSSYSNEPTVKT
jgi:hypothetical protein